MTQVQENSIYWRVYSLFLMPTRSMELLSGVEAAVLGIFLLLPYHTFASSPLYSAMAGLLRENTWGVLLIAVGLVQLAGVIGWWMTEQQAHLWRKWSALLMVAMYSFLASGFALVTIYTTAVPTYSLFALSQFWAYLNLELRG